MATRLQNHGNPSLTPATNIGARQNSFSWLLKVSNQRWNEVATGDPSLPADSLLAWSQKFAEIGQ